MTNTITYPEMARNEGDIFKRGVISLFPEASDILRMCPFMAAPTGLYGYQTLEALPENMGFRAINATPGKGAGTVSDYTERTYPLAHNIDIDRALIDRAAAAGNDRRTTEISAQATKAAQIWTDTFINGDNTTDPTEWTGLKQRLTSPNGSGSAKYDGSSKANRILDNSAGTSGGAVLSLTMLDIAIELTNGANAIIMPRRLKTRMIGARRNSTVMGNVMEDGRDQMGLPVTKYNDLPILTGYEPSNHPEFLDFNETAIGGGSAVTTSVYVVRFAEGAVCGLHEKPPEVENMGLLEDGVFHRVNYEHRTGLCIENGYSAIRLSGIKDGAIAA